MVEHTPQPVEVADAGEIVRGDGQRWSQCDIVSFEPALVEVKPYLTTTGLRHALHKVAKIKATSTAYVPPIGPARFPEIDRRNWGNMVATSTIVAAAGTSLSVLSKVFAEVAAELDSCPELMTDRIWVLNQGVLAWTGQTLKQINYSNLKTIAN